MPDLINHEIVREAMAGNASAFRSVVEQYQAFAYAVAFRFVRDADDAEDITQEAFVRLWKNLKNYRQEVKLTTWLYRIIANLCLDRLPAEGKSISKADSLYLTELNKKLFDVYGTKALYDEYYAINVELIKRNNLESR